MKTSVSHRKSTIPSATSLNGNGAKYLSYREAWARIKLARRQGFFLEAVTIEESIISDRLLSFLEMRCGLTLKDATKGNLNQIVQKWHVEASARLAGDPAEAEALEALNDCLQAWRSGRNEVVHGMVKSKARSGDDHIDNFLQAAEAYAQSGERLARDLRRLGQASGKAEFSTLKLPAQRHT